MTDIISSGAGITQSQWRERYSHALMNTFGSPQRVLVRGEGVHVWDADGNKYLDLLAGIAVNSLGHTHPTLTGAITAQFNTLGHVSNFFATPTQVSLAERLVNLSGAGPDGKVFFTNSGTEAMEAAYKLARKFGGQEKPRIIAMEGGFHGRSIGALTLTHKPEYKTPFEPLPTGVDHVAYGDEQALEQAMGHDVAAIVVEPIQGEAGVVVPPPGFLARVRELADHYGALVIYDEVQTGMGRVGAWFGHHLPHIGGGARPDVVALAKGLGSGFPVGAIITLTEQASTALTPGNHGTTFGGNPMAAAAGLATIHVIERDGLLENVTDRGAQLRQELTDLNDSRIDEIRGEGLLVGVKLRDAMAPNVVQAGLENGFILNAAAPDVIRLAPPLIIAPSHVEQFTSALPTILDQAEES